MADQYGIMPWVPPTELPDLPMGGNPFMEFLPITGAYQGKKLEDFPFLKNEETATPADWYKYAVLASLAGTAGAALGQAFRPRWGPPPPVAPPTPFSKGEVTAPASLSYLAATRRKRG